MDPAQVGSLPGRPHMRATFLRLGGEGALAFRYGWLLGAEMGMQRLRRLGVSSLLALASAAGVLWSADSSRAWATAPPARGGCLTFHQVHPEVRASGALQTRVPEGFKIY